MQKEKKKIRFAIHSLIAALALLLSCAAGAAACFLSPESIPSYYQEDFAIPEDARSIVDEAYIGMVYDCQSGRKNFRPGNLVNCLYITFNDELPHTAQSVTVILQNIFDTEVSFELSYLTDGHFSLEGVKDCVLPAGQNVLFFNIPKGSYHQLLLVSTKDFVVGDVLISENANEAVYSPRQSFSLRSVLVCFIVLTALFETLYFLRHEIAHALAALWRRRRGIAVFTAAAVLAAADGILIGRFVLVRMGIRFSAAWGVMLGLCTLLLGYQLWLLLRGEKRALCRQDRERGSRKLLFWGAAAVLFALIYIKWYDAKPEEPAFCFAFGMAVAEAALLLLLYRKYLFGSAERSAPYQKICLFLVFILGLAYMLVFLPFVSPDEMSHYLSAYRVSNGILGLLEQPGSDRLLMRTEDLIFYEQRMIALRSEYYELIGENMRPFAEAAGLTAIHGGFTTNAMFSYVFSGLGIAIARVLNLSGVLTFYAGRFANLLFFVFALGIVMRKLPFGKTALFVAAMLPMTLQLAGTYSYDPSCFCYAALFVSQVLYMAYSDRELTRRDLELCVFYGMLMAPSKMVYAPLLLMALIIPAGRLGEGAAKKKAAIICGGLLAVVLVMLFTNLFFTHSALRKFVQQALPETQALTLIRKQTYTLSWALQHPFKLIRMYIRTFDNKADYYLFTLLGKQLGWLNINIPESCCVLLLVLFLFSVNIREKETERCRPETGAKLWTLLLCFGSVCASMLVLLLDWTLDDSLIITGVQGRYFLPLAVPLIMQLKTSSVYAAPSLRRYVLFGAAACDLWVCVYVFASVVPAVS